MSMLDEAVREDIRCHMENGVSLNPYSTYGSITSWQNGFNGKPVGWGYPMPHARGKLCAQLYEELSEQLYEELSEQLYTECVKDLPC